MYDVRVFRNGKLHREKIESQLEVCSYLKTLLPDDKLVGVFLLSSSESGIITSVEVPCFVENGLVVLGKPM